MGASNTRLTSTCSKGSSSAGSYKNMLVLTGSLTTGGGPLAQPTHPQATARPGNHPVRRRGQRRSIDPARRSTGGRDLGVTRERILEQADRIVLSDGGLEPGLVVSVVPLATLRARLLAEDLGPVLPPV